MILIMLMIGLFLIAFGLIKQIKHNKKINNGLYEEVVGSVVGYTTYTDTDLDPASGHFETSLLYLPIIEYHVNNEKHLIEYNSSATNLFKKKIGKKVKIMYKKDNPQDAFIKKDYSGLFIFLGGILISSVCIIYLINTIPGIMELVYKI